MTRYGQCALAALLCAILITAVRPAQATSYILQSLDQPVVGEDQVVTTVYEDTLYDLASKYSLGSEELIRVNPHVDPWLPGAGKQVT